MAKFLKKVIIPSRRSHVVANRCSLDWRREIYLLTHDPVSRTWLNEYDMVAMKDGMISGKGLSYTMARIVAFHVRMYGTR